MIQHLEQSFGARCALLPQRDHLPRFRDTALIDTASGVDTETGRYTSQYRPIVEPPSISSEPYAVSALFSIRQHGSGSSPR